MLERLKEIHKAQINFEDSPIQPSGIENSVTESIDKLTTDIMAQI